MEESFLTQKLLTVEETFLSFLILLSLLLHNNLANLAPKHLLLQVHTRVREGCCDLAFMGLDHAQ